MNEAQTRHDLIDPALHEAGWNTLPARIATEQQVAPGRVESDGKSHKPEKADSFFFSPTAIFSQIRPGRVLYLRRMNVTA